MVLPLAAQPTVPPRKSEHLSLIQEQLQRDQVLLERFLTQYGLPLVPPRERRQMGLHRIRNGRPVYRGPLDTFAASALEADLLWPGGTGQITTPVSGAGQTIGIWEFFGLPYRNHTEFLDGGSTSRITHLGTHHVDTSIPGDHASYVTGIAAASGMLDPTLRSMAYQAQIHAYDDSLDLQEMTLAAANGLRVSNHAYGDLNGWQGSIAADGITLLPVWWGDPAVDAMEDYQFGFYDVTSKTWDALSAAEPFYTIVASAGNDRRGQNQPPGTLHWVFTSNAWIQSTDTRDTDGASDSGYDTIIGGIQSAKNVLSIGAIENIAGTGCSPSTPEDPLSMTFYSAWGPTDDGRIKPDFVAPGFRIRGTFGNDSNGSLWHCNGPGGTSWASPQITGSMALLLEHQENLWPGQPLHSSTFKALLATDAVDLGTPGPDYQFGWGMPSIGRAAELMQRNADQGGQFHIHEATLNQGQPFTLDVVSDGSPLVVTLAWIDPPGTPLSEGGTPGPSWIDRHDLRMLVNDLDLRVTGPGSVFPWTLDPLNPASPALQSLDNDRDNMEQIRIETPQFGATYQITISHKNTLAGGLQNFGLVVRGNLAVLPADHVVVDTKLFLQGPYTGPGMTTLLNDSGNGPLPLTQPYGDPSLAMNPAYYTGTESLPAGFLALHPEVVDWIKLELRQTSNGPTLGERAALLLSDGQVVDLDGTSPVVFYGITPGLYHVVVRHQNHLDAMTRDPIMLSPTSSLYDFSTSASQAFGNDLKPLGGGVFGLYGGDADANNTVFYAGALSDITPVLLTLGVENAAGFVNGYFTSDLDMNGTLFYAGAQSETNTIILSLGFDQITGSRSSAVPPN